MTRVRIPQAAGNLCLRPAEFRRLPETVFGMEEPETTCIVVYPGTALFGTWNIGMFAGGVFAAKKVCDWCSSSRRRRRRRRRRRKPAPLMEAVRRENRLPPTCAGSRERRRNVCAGRLRQRAAAGDGTLECALFAEMLAPFCRRLPAAKRIHTGRNATTCGSKWKRHAATRTLERNPFAKHIRVLQCWLSAEGKSVAKGPGNGMFLGAD